MSFFVDQNRKVEIIVLTADPLVGMIMIILIVIVNDIYLLVTVFLLNPEDEIRGIPIVLIALIVFYHDRIILQFNQL